MAAHVDLFLGHGSRNVLGDAGASDVITRGEETVNREENGLHRIRNYPWMLALIATLVAGVTFEAVRLHASAQTQPPAQGTQPRQGGRVFGTIQSVSAGSFVVTGRDGRAVTVRTGAATKVLGQTAAGLTDIKAGDAVRIVATKAQDGSYTALMVQDTPAGLRAGAPRGGGVRTNATGRVFVSGSVVRVSGMSLAVASADGTATTVTIPQTAKLMRTTALALTSLAAGAHVAVTGTPNQDGSLTASTIMVMTAKR